MRFLAFCTFLMLPVLAASEIVDARYSEPTDRYGHFALGPGLEFASLEIAFDTGEMRRITLPERQVFEDAEPRLWDVDGDSRPEVVTIISDVRYGAQLAIWDEALNVTTSPFIGQRNRWLAPIGAADLDGDGYIEIAWIDRPHLAKLLRVFRYDLGELSEVAVAPGLTNHRFGQMEIWSGLRNCAGSGWEIITADEDWSHVMASRFTERGLETWPVASLRRPQDITAALQCN